MTATVVLVHGAWHGAWCWDEVRAGLAARGVPALAVDLPGHGADRGPLADLYGDAARVSSVLDGVAGPVVLVGHSYGGLVVTQAGVHPSVAHLVFVAAFNCDVGESSANAAAAEAAAEGVDHSGRPNLAASLVVADGAGSILPGAATPAFYQDCPADLAAAAEAQLGPQLMVSLTQAPTEAAWRSRPSTYAVCSDDQGVHPHLQRILARRADDVVTWPTGHSPFLSRPELVVDLLDGLARKYAG